MPRQHHGANIGAETNTAQMFDLGAYTVATPAMVLEGQVCEVFDHWVAVHRSRPGVVALGDGRRRAITKAVQLYGVEVCKQAIDGCALSDFHKGRNKSGKLYDDIGLILRDEAHVERFVALAREAESGVSDAAAEFLAESDPFSDPA